MSWLELVAVFFSLVCVILSIYRNVWTWPTTLVGVVAYFILFWQDKLVFNALLQIIYFGQALYGWYLWATQKETPDELPVSRLAPRGWIWVAALTLALTAGLGVYMEKEKLSNLPVLDAAASSISMMANFLLARKILENWILWVVGDLLLVYIFFETDHLASAGLYLFFCGLATAAFFKWRKEMDAQTASSPKT